MLIVSMGFLVEKDADCLYVDLCAEIGISFILEVFLSYQCRPRKSEQNVATTHFLCQASQDNFGKLCVCLAGCKITSS